MQHFELFEERGLDWTDATAFPKDLLEHWPGLAQLTDREREVAYLAGIDRFPLPRGSPAGVLELPNPPGGSASASATHPPVIPRGRQFLTGRGRLVHPWESLRLQGLFIADRQLAQFDPRVLQDLAGNAFDAGCCTAVFLTGMLLLATDAGWQATSPARVLAGPGIDFAGETGDDEDEWDLRTWPKRCHRLTDTFL